MADNSSVEESKYKVALDLAITIAKSEQPQQLEPRDYWLRLYRQCIETVWGHKSMESILTGKPEEYSRMALRR